MKYKTGDILVHRLYNVERKVLGVCDLVAILSLEGNFNKASEYPRTEQEVDEDFTIKQSEWKPVYGEGYYLVGDNGVVICSNVIDDFRDKFRLATKNCFRTREEAEARLSEIKKEAGLI